MTKPLYEKWGLHKNAKYLNCFVEKTHQENWMLKKIHVYIQEYQ